MTKLITITLNEGAKRCHMSTKSGKNPHFQLYLCHLVQFKQMKPESVQVVRVYAVIHIRHRIKLSGLCKKKKKRLNCFSKVTSAHLPQTPLFMLLLKKPNFVVWFPSSPEQCFLSVCDEPDGFLSAWACHVVDQ